MKKYHAPKRKPGIAGVIADFRNELQRLDPTSKILECTDEEIEQIFWSIGDLPAEVSQIANAVNRASSRELLLPQFEEMAKEHRSHKLILKYAVRYFDEWLKKEGLGMGQGEYMRDAAKSCGKAVLVGGEAEVDLVADHWTENEDGHKHCDAANFVPGSGRVQVGVEGHIERGDSIFNPGAGSDTFEGDKLDVEEPQLPSLVEDEQAQEILAQWRAEFAQEAVYSHGTVALSVA